MTRRGRIKMSNRLKEQLATAKAKDWRRKLFKKQKGICVYCKRPMRLQEAKHNDPAFATLEHRVPLSRGGLHHWENVACACQGCNTAKADRTEEEWRQNKPRVDCLEIVTP